MLRFWNSDPFNPPRFYGPTEGDLPRVQALLGPVGPLALTDVEPTGRAFVLPVVEIAESVPHPLSHYQGEDGTRRLREWGRRKCREAVQPFGEDEVHAVLLNMPAAVSDPDDGSVLFLMGYFFSGFEPGPIKKFEDSPTNYLEPLDMTPAG